MKISIIIEGIEQIHTVNKSEVLIGRNSDADIQLSNEHISRKHIKIIQKDNEYTARLLTDNNWAICMGEEMQKDIDISFYEFGAIELPGEIKVKLVLDNAKNSLNMTSTAIKKIDLDVTPKKKPKVKRSKIAGKAKPKQDSKSKLLPILVFIAVIFLIASYLEVI